MLHRFLKTVSCIVMLLSVMVLQAQNDDPGMGFEDESGNVDDSELESEAPIGEQLVFLAVAGAALALFKYKLKKNDKQ